MWSHLLVESQFIIVLSVSLQVYISIRNEVYSSSRPALKITGFRLSFINLKKLDISDKAHLGFEFFGSKSVWAKTGPKT